MTLKSLFGKQGRASRIKVQAPEPTSEQTDLAICAIMKNEERFIEDWLRFHAIAGVRDFILYDHGSSDQSIPIARSVNGLRLTVVPWGFNGIVKTPEVFLPPQVIAYCHALTTFGGKFKRMAFIDIDEFLVPKSAETLQQCLDPLSGFSNISLPWTMFGPSGHHNPPSEPVFFAYEKRAKDTKGPLLKFKCIVDPCKVCQVSVHKFETTDMKENSVNDIGKTAHYKQRTQRDFISTGNIQLNHYYTKSLADMEEKIAGSAVSATERETRERSIREKLALIEKEEIIDPSAAEFLRRHGISSAIDLRNVGFEK